MKDDDDDEDDTVGAVRYACMPSLVALQQMRNRLNLAQLGKKLMKWTAQATLRELRRIAEELNKQYENYREESRNAYILLARARFHDPQLNTMVLNNMESKACVTVTSKPKSVAGVKILLYELLECESEPYNHLGLEKGGQAITEAKIAWRNLLKKMILLVEMRKSFIDVDIANKNATKNLERLQNKIIPRINATIDYTLYGLEEADRENHFRKRIEEDAEKKTSPNLQEVEVLTYNDTCLETYLQQTRLKNKVPQVNKIEHIRKTHNLMGIKNRNEIIVAISQISQEFIAEENETTVPAPSSEDVTSSDEPDPPESFVFPSRFDTFEPLNRKSDPKYEMNITKLKDKLFEVVFLSKCLLENTSKNVSVDAFLSACEDVKQQIEKFSTYESADNNKCKVDNSLLKKLDKLKFHLHEVMELTKEGIQTSQLVDKSAQTNAQIKSTTLRNDIIKGISENDEIVDRIQIKHDNNKELKTSLDKKNSKDSKNFQDSNEIRSSKNTKDNVGGKNKETKRGNAIFERNQNKDCKDQETKICQYCEDNCNDSQDSPDSKENEDTTLSKYSKDNLEIEKKYDKITNKSRYLTLKETPQIQGNRATYNTKNSAIKLNKDNLASKNKDSKNYREVSENMDSKEPDRTKNLALRESPQMANLRGDNQKDTISDISKASKSNWEGKELNIVKEPDNSFQENDIKVKLLEDETEIADETRNKLARFKIEIDDVIRLIEEYQKEGLLTPSVHQFIKSCQSVKNKINLYLDSEGKEKIEHLNMHVADLEDIAKDVNKVCGSACVNEDFIFSLKDFKTKLEDYKQRSNLSETEAHKNALQALANELNGAIELIGLVNKSADTFISCCKAMKEKLKTSQKLILNSDSFDANITSKFLSCCKQLKDKFTPRKKSKKKELNAEEEIDEDVNQLMDKLMKYVTTGEITESTEKIVKRLEKRALENKLAAKDSRGELHPINSSTSESSSSSLCCTCSSSDLRSCEDSNCPNSMACSNIENSGKINGSEIPLETNCFAAPGKECIGTPPDKEYLVTEECLATDENSIIIPEWKPCGNNFTPAEFQNYSVDVSEESKSEPKYQLAKKYRQITKITRIQDMNGTVCEETETITIKKLDSNDDLLSEKNFNKISDEYDPEMKSVAVMVTPDLIRKELLRRGTKSDYELRALPSLGSLWSYRSFNELRYREDEI